ncbi:MAG: hypothetical protein LBI27_09500 [Clostridiales bacterium]|jgi:hypothetical protein|nr:hypothetical protein [Clostridiales bacterium]
MKMKKSKSSLFLMEQIVVITVFAICAAVCVKILSLSFIMTDDAVVTRNALLAAENAAESFKAFSGDLERVVLDEDDRFDLSVAVRDPEADVIVADITVSVSGEEILTLTAAARRNP